MASKIFNFINTTNSDGTAEHLAIEIGFDYRKTINYVDSSSAAIDLTGATLTMLIKEAKSDVSSVLTLTDTDSLVSSGLYVADATTGTFILNIKASDTALLEDKKYLYELFTVDALLVKTLLIQGRIAAESGIL